MRWRNANHEPCPPCGLNQIKPPCAEKLVTRKGSSCSRKGCKVRSLETIRSIFFSQLAVCRLGEFASLSLLSVLAIKLESGAAFEVLSFLGRSLLLFGSVRFKPFLRFTICDWEVCDLLEVIERQIESRDGLQKLLKRIDRIGSSV